MNWHDVSVHWAGWRHCDREGTYEGTSSSKALRRKYTEPSFQGVKEHLSCALEWLKHYQVVVFVSVIWSWIANTRGTRCRTATIPVSIKDSPINWKFSTQISEPRQSVDISRTASPPHTPDHTICYTAASTPRPA